MPTIRDLYTPTKQLSVNYDVTRRTQQAYKPEHEKRSYLYSERCLAYATITENGYSP